MNHKIIVLVGLPGSGKTTFAKEWIKENPENRIRFNRDDIRNMMGKYWLPKRESVINDVFVSFMESSMSNGYDIIIDNMNLNPNALKEIEEMVENFNNWENNLLSYEIEIKSFTDISVDECVKRDSERENPVGEKTIRSIYEKYKNVINGSI